MGKFHTCPDPELNENVAGDLKSSGDEEATSTPTDGMDSSSDLVGIDVPKSVNIEFEKEES